MTGSHQYLMTAELQADVLVSDNQARADLRTADWSSEDLGTVELRSNDLMTADLRSNDSANENLMTAD